MFLKKRCFLHVFLDLSSMKTVIMNCWSISVPGVVGFQFSFPYFSGLWGDFYYWKWTRLEMLNPVQSCIYSTKLYTTSYGVKHCMFCNKQTIWKTSLEYSNRTSYVYKFPLLSLESNVKHFFSSFHGHNTNSGPHRTWCNCLQFDFLNYLFLSWQSVTNRTRQAMYV
jgi:hypothetical protein